MSASCAAGQQRVNLECTSGSIATPKTTEPRVRFYRSLRAVKVLLAALRSTLTVLAPQGEAFIGFRWRSFVDSSTNGFNIERGKFP